MPSRIPHAFTQEIVDTVCERLAGGESLRSVCRDENMPSRQAIYSWVIRHPDFADKYARSTSLREDYLFDEIIEIADTPQLGTKKVIKPDGSVETTEGDMIEHRRLRIDARKWALARMSPRKYGDRQINDTNLKVVVPPEITEDMTPALSAPATS